MKNSKIIKVILFVLAFPLGLFFFGMLVMYLWNFTLPQIFNVPPISFWQALGLLLLSKLLFGGFAGGWRRRNKCNKNIGEKLSPMSREEMENFKNEWRIRCGREGWTADKSAKPTKETTPE